MKGSVKKETNGTWTYIIDIGYIDGKRKQKRKRGFRTKKEADTALTEFIKDYSINKLIDSKGMSVGEYLQYWIDNTASNVSKSTAASYRRVIKYQLSHLSDNALEDLNPFVIQTLYTMLLKEYSPTSVNYAHRLLKLALKQAVKWRMLPYNPVEAVDPPKKSHLEIETLTVDEIDLLKEHLLECNREYHIPFLIAITTGMRRGEIAALEWSDISFENKRIYVSKAMKLIDKQVEISAPKNKSSSRSIGMTKSLTEALKTWKKEQIKNRLWYGEYYYKNLISEKPRDLVCTWENGRAIPLSYYAVGLKKAMRNIGIAKHVRFHDLRHTHATLLLEQNVEAKIVQERLGHSNISTTMDLYSHVTRNVQDKAVEKLDKIL
ncbi:MAG TPA: tyrosine-type recombinase/integrase [Clostridia bacterium]|nr:tyrosine-type recombinase/integrase [Clostridia bacterium]